jgi:hypothetical protein
MISIRLKKLRLEKCRKNFFASFLFEKVFVRRQNRPKHVSDFFEKKMKKSLKNFFEKIDCFFSMKVIHHHFFPFFNENTHAVKIFSIIRNEKKAVKKNMAFVFKNEKVRSKTRIS